MKTTSRSKPITKSILSWAMYDWANSAFAVVVLASFFPILFKTYAAKGYEPEVSTFYLGLANSLSSVLVLVFLPVLGYLADKYTKKKHFLLLFLVVGVGFTFAMTFMKEGALAQAMVFYMLAVFGFFSANVFYDALLPSVCSRRRMDWVSSFGYSMGYIGGGLLFAGLVVVMAMHERFGFGSRLEVVQFSFVAVCVWWVVFSIPIFVGVREQRRPSSEATPFFRQVAGFLGTAMKDPAKRNLCLFLLAYFFYIDGVNTVIKMAVDYGLSIGLSQQHMVSALLITQFVSFPFTILMGIVGTKWGPKKGILLAIVVYVVIVLYAMRLQNATEFYVLSVVIAFVMGGVQSLSRSLYAKLVPKQEVAFFFSLFNIVGKFGAILGPFVLGAVTRITSNNRIGISSLLFFFVVGAAVLWKVREVESPH